MFLPLERESYASETVNHGAMGLGEGAVSIRNTAGTCRDFLSRQQGVVHSMAILESLLTYQFPKPLWNPEVERGFSRSRPHPSRDA
jgi:hypothetical protein